MSISLNGDSAVSINKLDFINGIKIGTVNESVYNVSFSGVTIGSGAAVEGIGGIVIGHQAYTGSNSLQPGISLGSGAGSSTCSGGRNICIGRNSGSLLDGFVNDNVFIGYASGSSCTNTNSQNTLVGVRAGDDIDGDIDVDGANNNTCLGFNSGNQLVSGENNVFIGEGTFTVTTGSISNIAIGRGAQVNARNAIAIGTNSEASGPGANAIGFGADCTADYSFGIGNYVNTNFNNRFTVNLSSPLNTSFETAFQLNISAGSLSTYWEVNINGTDYKIPLHNIT